MLTRFFVPSTAVTLWLILVGRPPVLAEQSVDSDAGLPAYIKAISSAAADLDAGRISEARNTLKATEEEWRSFEYVYLLARADAAAASAPAPDLLQTMAAPRVETRYGVLNPQTRHLAYPCRDGTVRIRDLRHPDVPEKVLRRDAAGAIWSAAYSADGKVLFAGCENGDVVAWDAGTLERRAVVSIAKDSPVRELAAAPDGSAFVAEGASALELWMMGGDKPRKSAEVGERYNFGEGLAYSPKGDLIASGGMFDINLYEARTGRPIRSINHASYTMGLDFSPDGTRIASAPSGNINKVLSVFDVEKGEQLAAAGPFACYVHGGIFTADGKRVISLACEKWPVLQLFDAASGRVVFSLPRSVGGRKPCVTPDGLFLGWNEKSGYQYVDLVAAPAGKK